MPSFPPPLVLRSATLDFAARSYVMGVLNVTPDSFSDGGRFADPAAAVERARQMVAEGADLIDIGGESTRPGADPVPESDELARVLPVIEALAGEVEAPLSIDTYKASVARAAIAAGAQVINDISAGRMDPEMYAVAADTGAALVLSHIQGTPRSMQKSPHYEDVVAEVGDELERAAGLAIEAGVERQRIVLDPGIGFGKTTEHNIELIAHVDSLCERGYAVLVGTSRKSFIAKVLGEERKPTEREAGTAATVAVAIARGANLARVHDVKVMKDVARMADAIRRAA